MSRRSSACSSAVQALVRSDGEREPAAQLLRVATAVQASDLCFVHSACHLRSCLSACGYLRSMSANSSSTLRRRPASDAAAASAGSTLVESREEIDVRGPQVVEDGGDATIGRRASATAALRQQSRAPTSFAERDAGGVRMVVTGQRFRGLDDRCFRHPSRCRPRRWRAGARHFAVRSRAALRAERTGSPPRTRRRPSSITPRGDQGGVVRVIRRPRHACEPRQHRSSPRSQFAACRVLALDIRMPTGGDHALPRIREPLFGRRPIGERQDTPRPPRCAPASASPRRGSFRLGNARDLNPSAAHSFTSARPSPGDATAAFSLSSTATCAVAASASARSLPSAQPSRSGLDEGELRCRGDSSRRVPSEPRHDN